MKNLPSYPMSALPTRQTTEPYIPVSAWGKNGSPVATRRRKRPPRLGSMAKDCKRDRSSMSVESVGEEVGDSSRSNSYRKYIVEVIGSAMVSKSAKPGWAARGRQRTGQSTVLG